MKTTIRTKYHNRIEYSLDILNGKIHRENGPAKIYNDGTLIWYQNNEIHRTDGPAYIGPSGLMLWYINGIQVKPFLQKGNYERYH